MKSLTNKVVLGIEGELKDPEFRKHFFSACATEEICKQLYDLRKLRKLSQTELGLMAGMEQSAISRLEQPNYEGWTFKTLLRIAAALDCRLQIKFIPAEEAAMEWEGR